MAVDPEIVAMLANLTEIAARNTASSVNTRVRAVRAQRQSEQTISELEDIVNELLEDRNQLLRIARALEDELSAQRISDAEIAYITERLIPSVEKLMSLSGQDAESEAVEAFKALVSAEMLTVLQLIGFNFKEALGQPLTEVIRRLILSKVPAPEDAAAFGLLQARREVALLDIVKDPEASQRLSGMS